MIQQPKRPSFKVGDRVRISLRLIDPKVRERLKDHRGKTVVVKYTPAIYTIAQVFPAINTINGVRRESYSLISPLGNIAMAGGVVSLFYIQTI